MVFATGARIEDTYAQLLDKWFGNPVGLHLDSWLELDMVDGWRVTLATAPGARRRKTLVRELAPMTHDFTELHAIGFHVADDRRRAEDQRAHDASHFTQTASSCRTRTICTTSTIASRWIRYGQWPAVRR